MKGTIRATVKVAGAPQKEKRFVPGTPKRVIKAWKVATRAKLQRRCTARNPQAKAGTLAKDAERYYSQIKHLADWVSRRSEIRAWLTAGLADRYRHMITREDVLRIRGDWVQAGNAARTINNRVSALRHLYRTLDGDREPTPCDGVSALKAARTPPAVVAPDVVNRVLENLRRRQQEKCTVRCRYQGRYPAHCLTDRARLMVLASTGRRPCEVERTRPEDLDFRRRVWAVRDAKGGWSEGLYLNAEMIAAWETFIEADAWGPFPGHFAHRLRLAGWPAGVRPYNLRHSTWIEASERGADLADIQAGAGHKRIQTTRHHYVPVLNSRMQKLSERLDGRFGWTPRLVKKDTA